MAFRSPGAPLTLLLFAVASWATPASAQQREAALTGEQPAPLAEVVDRGVAFLRKAQAPDGSFSKHAGPGVTALIAAALMENGRSPDDPTVARAIEYVLGHVQPDGGIYQSGSRYRNYETCLAVMCLTAAGGDQYDEILQGADAFLKQLQWDEQENHDPSSESYGGAGYGNHSRPDLSNTTFFVETLRSLGNGPDDPAIQKALTFVSRCQNLESPYNQTKFASLNPDGGFYYTAAAGGTSQAGDLPNGGLRSYGSMTYAGLKSMLYAGVDHNDRRVKAAVEWAKKHYTVDENPGMGDTGYYYYLHVFAKALDVFGEVQVVDAAGDAHDWRRDLIEELSSRQQADGSFVNSATRWLEGDPNLATGYALLALAHCRD